MLALQQAYEVRASILEYLKATFTFKEKEVGQAFRQFIEDEQHGLFKGPYLSLKLPFVTAGGGEPIPLQIKPPFPPFAHQLQAFRRLTTRDGHAPEPTILTTGTGSGKTESFLYPVLDYCHRQEGRPGIKCIILYPMNALATDQANRLAKAIYDDPRLRGQVTAGLFIGVGRDGRRYPKDMAKDHIIENRDAILDAPPDILLTNFKMLDYALMRNLFHRLWRHNLEDAGLLRFLVLDELHTYDGAQGTDVANLIRRLKLKLNIQPGQLCPVGTSATIGSGEEAPRLLADYATRIFGEDFTEAAVIGEERVETAAFFGKPKEALYNRMPSPYKLQSSILQTGEAYEAYRQRQLDLWQIDPRIDPVTLGEELKAIRLVWDIVELCSRALLTVSDLIRKLNHQNEEFRKIPEWDAEHQFYPKESVIRSILSLIAEAKTEVELPEGTVRLPFLYLQVQLWVRELSGVLREVKEEPSFTWRDQKAAGTQVKALPAYFCRECGASGWLAVKHDNRNRFEEDVVEVYLKYFSNNKNIFFVNTDTPAHQPVEEYVPTELHRSYLSTYSLELQDREGPGRMSILASKVVRKNYNRHICPECNTLNATSIIGTRIPTLASITTGQVLASDLNPQPERDRKLLSFTNGVQDAAHHAGFIQARNYRFALRTALQQVINQSGGLMPLDQLQEAFVEYWKVHADEMGKAPLEAYLYKFFPSDRVGEVKIPAYKQKDGTFKPAFILEFDERVRWEVVSEFGYNAVIGRTLEKTGSSAIGFDQEKLQGVYAALRPWMEANLMGSFQEEPFVHFLRGLLHRLRIRGGIDHPFLAKYRTGDLRRWDLNWMKDKRHYMNRRFGSRSRFPKLITDMADSRGILDSTRTQKENWYHAYLKKSFPLTPYMEAVNEFYSRLLQVLTELEVLDAQKTTKGMRNYCLRPDALLVGNQVVHMECDTCGHVLAVVRPEQPFLSGAKCLQYRCLGAYRPGEEPTGENYYQQVYNRRRAPRIYATDHTGLLERRDRENKEKDFKERPRFNSLNTLVATSTLEMGIDIGDLNVTMNTAVPPLPSNFLQRVGRAGRKSGSALIVNFASSDPHDLFYFEEPLDMMAGEVSTPGCYLEAREILKRHFFAFCIDSWTSEDANRHIIPRIVKLLKPASADFNDPQFFLNRLLTYVKAHEQSLLERFRSMYIGQVEDRLFEELRETMYTEQFYRFPRSVFQSLKNEYRQLQTKRQEIKIYIKEKGLGQDDEEREDLEKELRNLLGTMKSIEKRQVLEYMTNTGLLPNYAFPETGVTLNARVMGRPSEGGDGPPLSKDIELVRPAAQAIRELMPDSHFYTQGYKLKVTGLNVINWKEEATEFRYCSNCDHLMEAVRAEKGNCPKCGHESWNSTTNKHQFLRFQGAKSFNDEVSATLDDSSEEREMPVVHQTHHFRFKPGASHGAYAMKEVPFGIEYVREVDVLHVNAGIMTDFMDRNRLTEIDGVEIPVSGYITCRSCGRSSSTTRIQRKNVWQEKEAGDYHYAYCKYRGKTYKGKSDEVFEEVFLYREMKTEALKILLPVQDFESESAVSMFKAGIELGLRKYYKGNPQHVRIREYSEYNFQTQKRDRYLVMYDVIPGGTGYLEKLFSIRAFNEVLQLAYEAIRDCSCQHRGKDGCYRCIFSYSNQFVQAGMSRERAERLFSGIVGGTQTWEKVPQGLGKVTNTGKIEESELELRFPRSLRVFAQQEKQREKGWVFEEENRDGVIGYRLKVVEDGNIFEYFIYPQYPLGPAQGVEYATIADFLIRCEAAWANGSQVPLETLQQYSSIAVYLDGYQFHASEEHPRFPLDVQRRAAINRAPELMTWTLTWSDLNAFDNDQTEGNNKGDTADALGRAVRENVQVRDQLLSIPNKYPHKPEKRVLRAKNNVSRLLWVLGKGPDEQVLRSHLRYYLACLKPRLGDHAVGEAHAREAVFSGTPLEEYPLLKKGAAFSSIPIPAEGNEFQFRIVERLENLDLIGTIRIAGSSGGYEKKGWDLFWKVFNLLQFEAEGFRIAFPEEKESILPATEHPVETEPDPEEVLVYYEEAYHDIVRQLLGAGIPFSEDGTFALVDEDDRVIAEAVLGFKEAKLVLGPLSEADTATFRELGYRIITPEAFTLNLLSKHEADHL